MFFDPSIIMVFIIMFDQLEIFDYRTSGFCWSSGSDINSSIESEPDLSRSWGFLRDYFFADSGNQHCIVIVWKLTFQYWKKKVYLPAKNVHIKRQNHHIWGLLATKRHLRFWRRTSRFWHLNTATFSYFACQKMGLGISRSKNEDHFLLPTLLTYGGFDTCLMWILNSGHYRATLWQMDNIFHFQILISRIRAPGSDLLSIEYFLTPDRLPLFNFQI